MFFNRAIFATDDQNPESRYFPMTVAAAAADGTLAATGDGIGQVVLWDVASREEIGVPWRAFGQASCLAMNGGGVGSIAFGRAERTSTGLLAGTIADIPVLLEVGLDCWKERACRMAGRPLDLQEEAFYLRGLQAGTCAEVLARKSAAKCTVR